MIFPGGGDHEELLYLLGILAHPDNAEHHFPLILTGPAESADYFAAIDRHGGDAGARGAATLQGAHDPGAVAHEMKVAMGDVKAFRQEGATRH